MQRLSAWSGLVSQAMALAGADGRLHLSLVKGGETPRLEIGAYDWDAQLRGNLLPLGTQTVILRAITLSEPFVWRETEAKESFDLSHWLGDVPQLWFIQGRSVRGFSCDAPKRLRLAGLSCQSRTALTLPHGVDRESADHRYRGTCRRM